MESHRTNRAYRAQCLKMRRKRYIGICPLSLRSHPKMELIRVTWTLLEGTVCQVDKIADRVKEKQTKYIELRAGIKKEYKSTSVYL